MPTWAITVELEKIKGVKTMVNLVGPSHRFNSPPPIHNSNGFLTKITQVALSIIAVIGSYTLLSPFLATCFAVCLLTLINKRNTTRNITYTVFRHLSSPFSENTTYRRRHIRRNWNFDPAAIELLPRRRVPEPSPQSERRFPPNRRARHNSVNPRGLPHHRTDTEDREVVPAPRPQTGVRFSAGQGNLTFEGSSPSAPPARRFPHTNLTSSNAPVPQRRGSFLPSRRTGSNNSVDTSVNLRGLPSHEMETEEERDIVPPPRPQTGVQFSAGQGNLTFEGSSPPIRGLPRGRLNF
ncbi:MAG: hypothetical protein COT84_03250 [Chlamydiae bacterium CG10_big_fil_rev_8_21_14_0_10_35_9]|nr:MAG: hypothetical protein COT84_03250 [Chlamydiae bacterium CG10_big_fil_rev_8_21_14_0_10_35_9]